MRWSACTTKVLEPAACGKAGTDAGAAGHWEVELRENGDPQEVLQACFARGIRLRSFNQAEPSLHEVFMRLVGI